MKKSATTFVLTISLLFLLELGLQLRAQWQYGQSLFSAVNKQPAYVFNPYFRTKTLRPSARIVGNKSVIVSNRLGLRDDDFPREKPRREIRVAFIGASTVMGANTADNQSTSSALLEKRLNESADGLTYQVINAGIAGLSAIQQAQVLGTLLRDYAIDQVIILTGMNDLASNCGEGQDDPRRDYSLAKISLPKWLLTYELVVKNSVALRTSVAKEYSPSVDLRQDVSDYAQGIHDILEKIDAAHLPAIFILNGKAFRSTQPTEEQVVLSQTARYYNSCYTLNDLYVAYDLYNRVLLEKTANHPGIKAIDLEATVPGGEEYFSDATHLGPKGDSLLTEKLFALLRGG